jgi:hypothetical protein
MTMSSFSYGFYDSHISSFSKKEIVQKSQFCKRKNDQPN